MAAEARIETHTLVQDFLFGDDLTLRRHDYSVSVAARRLQRKSLGDHGPHS
jgi:hypothetical protein